MTDAALTLHGNGPDSTTDIVQMLRAVADTLARVEAVLGETPRSLPNPDNPDDPIFLTSQAAIYTKQTFGVGSVSTLLTLASRGGGPKVTKLGPKLSGYTKSALDEWGRSRIREPRQKAVGVEKAGSTAPKSRSQKRRPAAAAVAAAL